MNLTDSEKRDKINSITRYIAYNVFNHKGKPNFINAYDKLKATVLLQWDFNINDRLKCSNKSKDSMFDVLYGDELDMVYKSSLWLMDMYKSAKQRKSA